MEPDENSNLFDGLVLKKKYDFPANDTYDQMIAVLKAGKKEQVVPRWQKKDIVDRFELRVVNEQEFVVGKSSGKRVLRQSEALGVLQRFHNQDAGHPGRVTLTKLIQAHYHSFPQKLATNYIQSCNTCAARKPIPKPPVGQPIRAKGVLTRLQVDLIDIRSAADGDVKWIMQVKDHFSKFVWLYSLERKDCQSVVNHLRKLFYTFGPCRILQTDNGGEFTGRPMKDLLIEFPAIKMIHGRARHPQSQGLVERANQTLERRLGAVIQDKGVEGWSRVLPKLAFEINRSYCRVHNTTPFQLMFSRIARDPVEAELEEIEEKWIDVEEEAQEEKEEEAQEEKEEEAQEEKEEGQEEAQEGQEEAQEGQEEEKEEAQGNESMVLAELVPPTPYLLFETEPMRAVAIGFRRMQKVVHGSPVKNSEICFEIIEVLTENPPVGKFDEPMSKGQIFKWPKSSVTNELGSTVNEVKPRIAPFVHYRLDGEKQAARYELKRRAQSIEVGSVVAMKIPRVDRANVDPHNLAAKVIERTGDYLTLQSGSGVIQSKIHVDQVAPWPSSCPPEFPPLQDEATTSVVGAFRSATLYRKNSTAGSICNCASGCKSRICPCVKSNIGCGTKCHRGKQCQNKSDD